MLKNLATQQEAQKSDPLKDEKEKNAQLKPFVEEMFDQMRGTLVRSDFGEMTNLLFTLLNKQSKTSHFFVLIDKGQEAFDNLGFLIERQEFKQVYARIVSDSHYEGFSRAQKVTISMFSAEKIQAILDAISDNEVKLNLVKSLLLGVLEEIVHFLEFCQMDGGGSPFLSQKMKDVAFYKDSIQDINPKIEADITYYFIESDIQISGTFWLEYHRDNYGDEKRFVMADEIDF